MKSVRSRLAALVLAAVTLVGLTGCAGEETLSKTDATAYVQGVLNATYKQTWDAVYLDMTGLTEAQAQKAYDEGLKQEYQRFTYQFQIRDEYLSFSVRQSVQELLKDLTKRASYSVKGATLIDDARYAVEVAVRPMDIFRMVAQDDLAAYKTEFEKKWSVEVIQGMDSAQLKSFYQRYENDWARGVVKLCRDKYGVMGNLDVQPILVLVAPDDAGVYRMQDNDFANLSTLILPY